MYVHVTLCSSLNPCFLPFSYICFQIAMNIVTVFQAINIIFVLHYYCKSSIVPEQVSSGKSVSFKKYLSFYSLTKYVSILNKYVNSNNDFSFDISHSLT